METKNKKNQLDLFEDGAGDTTRRKADTLFADIDKKLHESDITGAKSAAEEQEIILKAILAKKRKELGLEAEPV